MNTRELVGIAAVLVLLTLTAIFVNFETAFVLTIIALIGYAFWGDRVGRKRRNPEVQRINEEEISERLREAWNGRRNQG